MTDTRSAEGYPAHSLLPENTTPRLERDEDWYKRWYFDVPLDWGINMPENFRRYPDKVEPYAATQAAQVALNILYPDIDDEAGRSNLSKCFTDIARAAITAHRLDPDLAVDNLPIEDRNNISSLELREVGRLAIQMFDVFSAMQLTSEVHLP